MTTKISNNVTLVNKTTFNSTDPFVFANTDGWSNAMFYIEPNGGSITFEVSPYENNFETIEAFSGIQGNKVTSTTVNGIYSIHIGGVYFLRINSDNASNATISGTVSITQNKTTDNDNIVVDGNKDVKISIRDPKLPFNSIHTESITPVFQVDGLYTLNTEVLTDFSNASGLGGSATVVDSAMICNTTTNLYGNATLQSKKRIRYRPGQGSILNFTAQYTAGGAPNTYQVVGMGHSEDGYFFAFKNTNFGILALERNLREIRELTITTASTTTENITITLNGVAYSVPVTNSGNINRTAWEISIFDYDGWYAEQRSDDVRFLASGAGSKNGTYSLAASTAVGTFSLLRAGDATTYPETFTTQNNWNMDVMDGSGSINNPSGILLDVSKINIYQISMKYLGSGEVKFSIEINESDNRSQLIPVHIIKNTNNIIRTHVGNPTFPFTMSAYKFGDATDLTLKVFSCLAAVEGQLYHHGPRFTYRMVNAAVGTGSITVLGIIRNKYVRNNVPNQSLVSIRSILAAAKGNVNALTTIYLIRNGIIAGNPAFTPYATNKSSTLFTDATGMTVTTTDNSDLLFSGSMGESGQLDHYFNDSNSDFLIQPGEYIVVGAEASTSTSNVIVSINTRED